MVSTMNYFSLDDFQNIIFNENHPFYVSTEINNIFTFLEKELNIINPVFQSGSAPIQYRKSAEPKEEESWIKKKEQKKSTENFKTTKINETKDGSIEKKINEMRVLLNKISSKNYSTQKDVIIESIRDSFSQPGFDEHVFVKCIFDIISSNKFLSDIYAQLYKELILIGSIERRNVEDDTTLVIDVGIIFFQFVISFFCVFRSSIDEIHYVDHNDDYDGFCNYTKINDQRRALTTFFVNLVKYEVIKVELLEETLDCFLNKSLQYIDEKDRINEIEEITENIFIIVSFLKKECSKSAIEKIKNISSMKAKEKSSLSSRIIFKYMDIVSLL